tara:strand:+ start:14637 stop:14960 length:324 start_codon:yes stop_codon:yes gene_type:complete
LTRVIYIFTYGSLQEEEIQSALYGRNLKGKSDCLLGYALLEQKVFDQYPVIHPSLSKTDIICGMVYEISEKELLITDVYEGDSYKRIEVALQSGKIAWVYTRTLPIN